MCGEIQMLDCFIIPFVLVVPIGNLPFAGGGAI